MLKPDVQESHPSVWPVFGSTELGELPGLRVVRAYTFLATILDSRSGAHVQTSFPGLRNQRQLPEKEEWFAVRDVTRLECGVDARASSMSPFNNGSCCMSPQIGRLRTTAHCENAILPFGFLPGFGRECGQGSAESDEAVRPRSRVSVTGRITMSFRPIRCGQ